MPGSTKWVLDIRPKAGGCTTGYKRKHQQRAYESRARWRDQNFRQTPNSVSDVWKRQKINHPRCAPPSFNRLHTCFRSKTTFNIMTLEIRPKFSQICGFLRQTTLKKANGNMQPSFYDKQNCRASSHCLEFYNPVKPKWQRPEIK